MSELGRSRRVWANTRAAARSGFVAEPCRQRLLRGLGASALFDAGAGGKIRSAPRRRFVRRHNLDNDAAQQELTATLRLPSYEERGPVLPGRAWIHELGFAERISQPVSSDTRSSLIKGADRIDDAVVNGHGKLLSEGGSTGRGLLRGGQPWCRQMLSAGSMPRLPR